MGDVEDRLPELRERIAALAVGSAAPRWYDDDLSVFATAAATAPMGTVGRPSVALVAQGVKRSALGEEVFEYRAGQFLVVTLDLPLTSHIAAASPAEPFLAFSMPLEAGMIAQLLLETEAAPGARYDGPPLAVSTASEDLLDAVVRLLRLVGSPADRPVLARAVRREIHWRLLSGPQGGLVRQIGLAESRIALVARAIAWIRDHYDETLHVPDLAAGVGLSVSTLNRHFRAATSMSPLQYQKQLRLQRARLRLLASPGTIAAVGHEVGYDSASQFSREYRRLFGLPPALDAQRLQGMAVVPD
ncbi:MULTISPECIES: AraC family transcriptional regulator [unclassified Pseudofrankia]|uniref:AraC family transcriptional regulator n=1 Tax=unclassified Pseudofrankia TaxID=2994372 RepID=UPI000B138E15|nr:MULTISPECIES: AraC family transcriptional regulator [unclassified Pseudofrankia]MDT3445349.1 AraC family transcriptional regulator [Pseudofrankia sp. BMG5.37]